MRLTERDIRLLKDMALSHVLSRDQIVALRYFGSVTRVNTRVRGLRKLGLVRRIETPFFAQSLYSVSVKAADIVGERIAPLIGPRGESPRFLQHALSVTNVRLALLQKGAEHWRFEQQLRASFSFAGREFQVRPDGMAIVAGKLVAVEVDLGHVAPAKFREKLRAFDLFVTSGECSRQWNSPTFKLLAITTGKARAASLRRLASSHSTFPFECFTFDECGIARIGGWS
jgi:hypothetical protein